MMNVTGADETTKPNDPAGRLQALVSALGGPEELLGLLDDYRKVVGVLAAARDARTVLPDVRCLFSRKSLYRMAVDLPEEKGRALLGR
jgi:hypothetical protein